MGENRSVSYIKNNNLYEKKEGLLNKNKLLKNIIELSCNEQENQEIYEINSNIEYLIIKNMTFKKNIKIIIPNQTILVLDNCTFNKGKIEIEGGITELKNPNLNTSPNSSYISLKNTISTSIILDKENRALINIKGNTNDFSLTTKNKANIIESLYIKSNNIKLNNFQSVKTVHLDTNNIIINNCEIDIKDKEEIKANNLNLTNSTIYSQACDIKSRNIYLKDSYIFFNWCFKGEGIQAENIILTNSKLHSIDNLNIEASKIIMDESSKIIGENTVKLPNEKYTTTAQEDTIELDLKKIKQEELIKLLKILKKELKTKYRTKVLHLGK